MLSVILGVMGLFAQTFGGTWTCHSQGAGYPWIIASAPGGAWTSVRWANQTNADGGIAYVGYVEPNKQWIYEDFHYDGSYAINTSDGPHGNVWTWAGTYFNGQNTQHGQVVWKLSSATRIDRTFVQIVNGKAAPPAASDYCVKAIQ